MVDEPENRRAIDAKLRPVYEALTVTGNPIPIKAALNLLGLPAGGLRLPLVEASEEEIAVVRTALEQHGLLRPVAS
jgi:4-hydroxy-tetrahydrodipicolinate synthase